MQGESAGMSPLKNSLKRWIAAILVAGLGALALAAQQLDTASVIQRVDAAVKARVDHVASYTVTEHYAVFRGSDETHSVAEMTVQTVYRRDSGKNYTILSGSGSEFIRTHVLGSILDSEKNINLPGNREHSWLTSANYQMQLKPGGIQRIGHVGMHHQPARIIHPRAHRQGQRNRRQRQDNGEIAGGCGEEGPRTRAKP